ncbi:MAG: sugar phosphate nucleotidyltransferase [Desulfobulbaceae bacterium]|nr:sugar phosphate nucleotidyltransferase [Desulfobulbaceae bacterium]
MFKPSTLAMILAGGRVDELGVLTYFRPKSAVPFGGFARVIDFALSNLLHSSIELVAILSQYRSYSLINHIGTGEAWDMIGRYRGISILPPFKDYENPDWYRGSADAVYQNLDFVQFHEPSEILILSGDHIYQMDYREMIKFHIEKKADLTAAFIEVDDRVAHRFGIGEIDYEDQRGGKLVGYEEKPKKPRSRLASLTILCFRPQVLYEMLAENQKQDSYEFGRDIIPAMMQRNYNICGYVHKGYWGYTRTVDEYWKTSMDLLGKNPKINLEEWGLRTNMDHRNIRDCQPLLAGSGVVIDNSMAYNGCCINGIVRNSILFPDVIVEKGAEVHDSVLFFNTVVKKGARLQRVVSDVNTTFGAGCRVGGGRTEGPGEGITVIGWNNKIPDNMQIGRGCTVYPQLAKEKWTRDHLRDNEVLR